MPITTDNSDYLARMRRVSSTILDLSEAITRTKRELNVGVVNLMPDPALKHTETQFTLPLDMASSGLHIVPHFIALGGIERSTEIQEYIDQEYITFDQAQEKGLDALIITGANIADPDLRNAAFFEPLKEVIAWSKSDRGPTSTLFSCLASHAYMLIKNGQHRIPLNQKRWGVYEHNVRNENHPLTQGMDSVVNFPHSRWNEISEHQFNEAGMNILIDSKEAGIHMATSPDGLRAVLWQGHPEYNTNSLLKEWQRDIGIRADRRKAGENIDLAPYPHNYLKNGGYELAEEFRKKVEVGDFFDLIRKGKLPPEIEKEITKQTPNLWRSSSNRLFSNWIAAVVEKTHEDRHRPFMDGINPDNIFNLPEQSPV